MARGVVRRENFTKDTLLKLAKIVTVGGAVVIASTSPYFLHYLVRRYFKDASKKIAQARAKKLRELEKRKLVAFHDLGGGNVRIELTHRGNHVIREYNLETMKLAVPKQWDKIWRIVMYDIPSSQRKTSNALREKFRQLGLCQLQKSVWVSPYECLAEIEFLCSVFDIDMNACVHYFRTQEIPKEKEVLDSFNLS